MRNNRRSVWLILAVVAGTCWTTNAAGAAEKFNPGDIVERQFAGRKEQGEVVGPSKAFPDMVEVKFSDFPVARPVRIKDLKLVRRAKAAAGDKEKGNKEAAPAAKPAEAVELRKWTSKDGKFSVEARFRELKENNLSLERADGKVVTIPLDKLSDADRKYAQDKQAAPADENPFKVEPGGDDPQPAGPPLNLPPLKTADRSAVKTITIDAAVAGFSPDPGPPAKVAEPTAITVAAGAGHETTLSKHRPFILPAIGQALVATGPTMSRDAAVKTVLGQFDLATGRQLAEFPLTLPAGYQISSVDAAGKWVVATPGKFAIGLGGKNKDIGDVLVWQIYGGKLQPVVSWNAASGERLGGGIEAVIVLGGDRLLVQSREAAEIWDIAKASAVLRIPLEIGAGAPAVSPGRNQIALAMRHQAIVIDARSGACLARLPTPQQLKASVAFSPSGKQLAVVGRRELLVVDLEKGVPRAEVFFKNPGISVADSWVDENHLLVDGRLLVDIEHQLPLWSLTSRGQDSVATTGWLWGVPSVVRGGGILPLRMPPADVLAMAKELDPKDYLAIKPGTAIRLNVAVEGSPAQQAEIRSKLEAAIKAAGLKLGDPSSPVQLNATTGVGETTKLDYQDFHRRRKVETVSFTPKIAKVTITEAGQELWSESTQTHADNTVWLKEGQTVQSVLDERSKIDLGYFSKVRVPKQLARVPKEGALSSSTLGPTGLGPLTRHAVPKPGGTP